ncbi:rod shape-determining protein RodA, partial [Patescibacteria group bacterium]|nr:rod shape-determining protein RodA [Patescibacteria group bacterium]
GSFFSQQKSTWRNVGISLLLISVPAGLVFVQPDLGSALLFSFVWLAGVFLWLDKKKLVLLGLGIGLTATLGWGVLRDYQKDRFESFLHPASDPLGTGYHLIQAKIAAGSGKLFGRGLLRGTQSHLRFLPERHSDFIFASLAEELGFFGSFLVLGIYFSILAQIFKAAKRAKDPFGMYLCLGVFGMIFSQVVVNIGMNIGLLPITGITLPFLSTGGSSIIALMIGLGLVESTCVQSETEGYLQIK